MVSIVLLILAPVLLGAIILGTVLLSSDKKPNASTNLGNNITTTAQLITTVLIPDKVTTAVSLVFSTPTVVGTIPPMVPSMSIKDADPSVTTTKALPQSTVRDDSPPPSSSKPKLEATPTLESPTPTPTKGSGWTILPGITIPNPFDLFKPVEPPKPTTATTTANVAPTKMTTTKEIPMTAIAKETLTTTITKDAPTTLVKEVSTSSVIKGVPTTTTAAIATKTITMPSPSPIKSGITIFPGITIPNPLDLFKPVEPPKPTTATTTASVAPTEMTTTKEIPMTAIAKETLATTITKDSPTTLVKEVSTSSVIKGVPTTTTAAIATKTITMPSPSPTKSGITIFPGITIPNPFDLFKPAEPAKPATTTTAVITPTKTTVVKEVPKSSTATTTTTVPNPSPTKKPGFTIFPGITLPNPFALLPDGHPGGEKGSLLHRRPPGNVDDITNSIEEGEGEEKNVKNEDHEDIGDEWERVHKGENKDRQDEQDQAEADSVEDWEDENFERKSTIQKGSQQKALRQRSLKRVQRHHHHRRSTRRAQLLRRQKLSFHDVTRIARNINVSPPVKTLHLFTEVPASATTVTREPTTPPHASVHVDIKDTLLKETDSKEYEKMSIPLLSPPVFMSEPPASPQSVQEPEAKDSIFQELGSVIDKLIDAQTESFEESLNLIVNNLILSDEMEPYQDFLFESFAVSKFEIPESNDDDLTLDFGIDDDQVDALYSFRTSPPSSSDNNRVFPGPRAVSRASILTSILNTFLPPFILRFRADMRNFLYWICSPNASAHIDGKDASGDDSWAKSVAQDDINKLIHHDGSIDLKSIWDPKIATLALECIKDHAQIFWNEVTSLMGTRFTQIKEFLVDQLRGLIGLPQFFGSSAPADQTTVDSPDQQPQQQEQQEPQKDYPQAQGQHRDSIEDLDTAGQYTQKDEPEASSYSSPSSPTTTIATVTQEDTTSSSVLPHQRRKQGKPSPAFDQAQNPQAIQRTEPATDKGDEFVTWFVDTVVNELQKGYFAEANKASANLQS